VAKGTNFDDYPPEFDLSLKDLQRYGVTEVWAAYHDPTLRPKVFRKWRAGSRSFPIWVAQEIYAQRHARRQSPWYLDWERPVPKERPPWQELYAPELIDHPELAFAISTSLGEVFRRAKLSASEAAVMKRLCSGMDLSAVATELGITYWNANRDRWRAVKKFRKVFLEQPISL